MALCSNPLMKDGKLNIQAEKWFVKLKEDTKPLKEEYERLELKKNPLNTQQKEALTSLRLKLWT